MRRERNPLLYLGIHLAQHHNTGLKLVRSNDDHEWDALAVGVAQLRTKTVRTKEDLSIYAHFSQARCRRE